MEIAVGEIIYEYIQPNEIQLTYVTVLVTYIIIWRFHYTKGIRIVLHFNEYQWKI